MNPAIKTDAMRLIAQDRALHLNALALALLPVSEEANDSERYLT